MILEYFRIVLLLVVTIVPFIRMDDDAIYCGFPGSPAFGFVRPENDSYTEGSFVKYSCRVGYILQGASLSRCTKDGDWSEKVPVCDDSMTMLGVPFSTATFPGHGEELAVDRNRATCTHLKPKQHRWWRIDLGHEYRVMTVAVTMEDLEKYVKFVVYVVKTEGTNADYKICASFSGKFGTQTAVLQCELEDSRGILGQKIHIEDQRSTDGSFEICEVEIQVEKDSGYDCGKPSRSVWSVVSAQTEDVVEYGCKTGYRLMGHPLRDCQTNGQWTGQAPQCQPIVCETLDPLEHGTIAFPEKYAGLPLEGAVALYECDAGFRLVGAGRRDCQWDGAWTGSPPRCKVIRCPVPETSTFGGFYRLLNKSNSMGSIALLRCPEGHLTGDNPYITCLGSGRWSQPEARCFMPARSLFELRESPKIENQGALFFGMVVAAIMIVVVLVSIYLYSQSRLPGGKPLLPSRSAPQPAAPPRPPKSLLCSQSSQSLATHQLTTDQLLHSVQVHELQNDVSQVYAAVDYGKKRESRLLRESPTSERQNATPTLSSRSEEESQDEIEAEAEEVEKAKEEELEKSRNDEEEELEKNRNDQEEEFEEKRIAQAEELEKKEGSKEEDLERNKKVLDEDLEQERKDKEETLQRDRESKKEELQSDMKSKEDKKPTELKDKTSETRRRRIRDPESNVEEKPVLRRMRRY